MATSASVSSATTSDWVEAQVQTMHRIDVNVPDTVTAISYTVETTDLTSNPAKTLKKPNDVDSDWTWTNESAAFVVEGNGHFRLNVSSYSGTGDVSITIREIRPQ